MVRGLALDLKPVRVNLAECRRGGGDGSCGEGWRECRGEGYVEVEVERQMALTGRIGRAEDVAEAEA